MQCVGSNIDIFSLIPKGFDSSVGFKIGYSGKLTKRMLEFHNCHCKVDWVSFRAFPGEVRIANLVGLTKNDDNPVGFVYWLEKIMHEIFVAHQYDISCKHGDWGSRTTHTEFFWFKSAQGDNARSPGCLESELRRG